MLVGSAACQRGMLADSERIEKRSVEHQKYLNYSGVSSATRKPTSTTRTTPKRGPHSFPAGLFTRTEMPKHNWVKLYPIRLTPRKPKPAYPITKLAGAIGRHG